MRFAQFLRRLSGTTAARPYTPRYQVIIVGSSQSLHYIKKPLFQGLHALGASITRAQSSLLHEDQRDCTALTIDFSSNHSLGLKQLALSIGQEDGIKRVQVKTA